MSNIAHIEVSPSTIQFEECENCHGDKFSFDILALNDNGVRKVTTVRECPGCEEGGGNG